MDVAAIRVPARGGLRPCDTPRRGRPSRDDRLARCRARRRRPREKPPSSPAHPSAETDNPTAVAGAGGDGVVAVTVPFAGQAEIYRSIKDAVAARAVVLDATSPLATAVGGRPQVLRPWHGSAAEQAQAILGDGPRVVAGFHSVAAESLRALDQEIDSDVLLCANDAEAKERVRRWSRGSPACDGWMPAASRWPGSPSHSRPCSSRSTAPTRLRTPASGSSAAIPGDRPP